LIESTTAASAVLAPENLEVIVDRNLAGLPAFWAEKNCGAPGFPERAADFCL
jgi:hypothetical protein